MLILQRTGQNALKKFIPQRTDYTFEDDYRANVARWKENEEAIEKKIQECKKHNALEQFTLHYQSSSMDGTSHGALICKNCGEIFEAIIDPLELNQLLLPAKNEQEA